MTSTLDYSPSVNNLSTSLSSITLTSSSTASTSISSTISSTTTSTNTFTTITSTTTSSISTSTSNSTTTSTLSTSNVSIFSTILQIPPSYKPLNYDYSQIEISSDSSLPRFETMFPSVDKLITYVNDKQGLEKLNEFCKNILIVGIDCESNPIFRKGIFAPVSLLQLAVYSTNKVERVFLIDLLQLSGGNGPAFNNPYLPLKEEMVILDSILLKLFSSTDILKIGQNLSNDLSDLHTSFPQMKSFQTVNYMMEICAFLWKLLPSTHSFFGPSRKGTASGLALPPVGSRIVSLQKLTACFLNKFLCKKYQASAWARRPLLQQQMVYAACDALVLIRLFFSLYYESIYLFGEKFNLREICEARWIPRKQKKMEKYIIDLFSPQNNIENSDKKSIDNSDSSNAQTPVTVVDSDLRSCEINENSEYSDATPVIHGVKKNMNSKDNSNTNHNNKVYKKNNRKLRSDNSNNNLQNSQSNSGSSNNHNMRNNKLMRNNNNNNLNLSNNPVPPNSLSNSQHNHRHINSYHIQNPHHQQQQSHQQQQQPNIYFPTPKQINSLNEKPSPTISTNIPPPAPTSISAASNPNNSNILNPPPSPVPIHLIRNNKSKQNNNNNSNNNNFNMMIYPPYPLEFNSYPQNHLNKPSSRHNISTSLNLNPNIHNHHYQKSYVNQYNSMNNKDGNSHPNKYNSNNYSYTYLHNNHHNNHSKNPHNNNSNYNSSSVSPTLTLSTPPLAPSTSPLGHTTTSQSPQPINITPTISPPTTIASVPTSTTSSGASSSSSIHHHRHTRKQNHPNMKPKIISSTSSI